MILNFSILSLILFLGYVGILIYNSFSLTLILGFFVIVVSTNVIIRKVIYNKIPYGNINISAQIIDIKETTNSFKLTIKSKSHKYIFYEKDNLYHLGDIIIISGELSPGDSAPSYNLFNYQKYLENNNIKGIIKNQSVKIIDNKFCLQKINYTLHNYFKTHFKPQTCGFLEALVIGYKNDLGDEITTDIQTVGISHLFVISGLHMGILLIMIKKLLNWLKIKPNLHFYIITCLFFIYYIVTLFSISILRILVVYVLSNINKKLNLKLNTLNIFSLSVILILLVQPYYLFSYAFLLTYLSSISLVLISPLLKYKGVKGFIINNLIISLNSMIVTLPVVISLNPEINLLSIVYNLFYIPFVTYVLLPLSFMVTFCPYLEIIYLIIINGFIKITKIFSDFHFLRLVFPKVSILIIISYYLVYLKVINNGLNNKVNKMIKSSYLLVFILIVWSNIYIFNPYDELIFLNLPKGEATLICKAFNQANILIDTGEDLKNDLEIFLMKKGIKRIDYLFISHGDSDHNGKIPLLIKKFKINNVVITPYDSTTFKMLVNNNYKGRIIQMKKDDIINYKNLNFKALSPAEETKKNNNNSLVLYIKAFNNKILLTGDIEKEQEEWLIKNEKKIEVNFFKIPHHGSNTSSSNILLNNLKFDYAICMNGYLNSYSFPTSQTTSKYPLTSLLITSNEKTIVFKKMFFISNLKRINST